MKKLLTIAALIGVTSLSFGQGTVNFFNTTKTTVRTNSAVGGPTTGVMDVTPNHYYFALFAAPTTTTTVGAIGVSDGAWTFTGLYANNSATLGVFSGGTVALPVNAAYAAGSTVNMFAAGWSDSVGTTVAQAQSFMAQGTHAFNGWYGQSIVATGIVLGGGPTPAGTPFGTLANQAGSFSLLLQPIPEPSSFALAGLGAAALMIFRRRKQ